MNKIQDAFDSVKADTRLKESTKQFLFANRTPKSHSVHQRILPKIAVIACMILIFASGITGYRWIQIPVSYISIDVNPSIELTLNRFDRVLSATAYNAEGQEILENLSLNWKKYADAVNLIVESKNMANYLTEESELIFTIAADPDRNGRLTKTVKSISGHAGHRCQSYHTDTEIVPEAHDNGLSLGKYYAYLQLYQYDGSITVDDCKDMSTSEIHCLTKEHEQNEKHWRNGKHWQNETTEQDEEGANQDGIKTEDDSTSTHHGKYHHQKDGHE
ncbi:MAG: hypothetical protein HFJ06_13140 [Lachnospiraceae bacterium]|nr:hypothetical protein [Lachnospiraceae bacterium]